MKCISPEYRQTAYQIIDEIQKELNYEFKNKIVINNIHVNNYNSAVNISIYYGGLNNIKNNLSTIQKIKNRKLSSFFILLSTHMKDRPFVVNPRTRLII